MQPQINNNIRSQRQLHKLSAFVNVNNNHTIPTLHETKHNRTLKTIKTLKPLNNQKQLSYLSSSSSQSQSQQSTKHLTLFNKKSTNNNNNSNNASRSNMFYSSSRDIQRLYQLLTFQQRQQNQQEKQIQVFEQIDSIFCRHHLSFFQSLKSHLTIPQYHQLISKCRLLCFAEDKIISQKNNQDMLYYVLVQGQVKVYQQKVMKNVVKQQDQIEYVQMYTAQKGILLNSQTLNSPKHNSYTIITHSITTLIAFNSHETYSKLLKKYFIKQSDQHSISLSNTSLFKGISPLNIKKLLPYFFNKNFFKFNQNIYKQGEKAEFVYWILQGQVQLLKEYGLEDYQNNKQTAYHFNSTSSLNNNINSNNNKKQFKIVKLSKYEIFGIDDYPFQTNPKYHFTARVTSQSLKTICISYKSLIYIQNQYPCINENIDFYLKRSTAMHSKILQKNHRLLQIKDNNNNFTNKVEKKKKNKRNKKNKKKFPQQMEWWGLAQNNVGSKKYKLQLPKFITLQQSNSTQLLSSQKSKTQPMFDTSNYRSTKIQQFRRKLFEQDIDDMIEAQQRKKSNDQNNQSPYKLNYIPKINKLKIKVLDVKPKMIDETQKVKKKLLSYAKNMDTFCDKLNLD